jgi:hypothetical protein
MSMEHGRDLEFDGEERDLSEASMAYEYFVEALLNLRACLEFCFA